MYMFSWNINMKLIYLIEGKNYQSSYFDFASSDSFVERLRDSINKEFDSIVVKENNNGFVFHYIGLYDYVDSATQKNYTFFFVPKFINDIESFNENDRNRNAVILAIDRYNKEQTSLTEQTDSLDKKRESVLELAVRFLRNYLENGLYIVHKNELELNGQGEINWETTIEQFDPVIIKGRPYYLDYMTEQAYSDENHYITQLQKCLITVWGSKLEKLGLASVLRVNVPLLSEDSLDYFGDSDYQISQINKELNVTFVTKSRETLKLMKELIQRFSENEINNHESLSFGMTGVEHLWERACAEVFRSELDKTIRECGIESENFGSKKFRDYMPNVSWSNGENESMVSLADEKDTLADDKSENSTKSGWRLDFIRTHKDKEGKVDKLVILDSKYYCIKWENGKISGQPGIPDIAKQMFYQMSFKDLVEDSKISFVNALLIPEDDNIIDNKLPKKYETVKLGWGKGSEFKLATAFKDIDLFTVRIPGISLFKKYSNYEIDDDWFETIVNFTANSPHPRN